MKHRITAALAAVALAGGLTVVATAAPASAHTPVVTATCEAVVVNATDYQTKPAVPEVTEERELTPAVEYQPAVTEQRLVSEAVAEVSHTDYEYEKQKLTLFGWAGSGEFRFGHSDQGEHWYDWSFWKPTGVTEKHVEVEGVDAVYETVVITPEVPAQDATYETVVVSPAIAADETPNTIVVTIDGVEVRNAEFGASFSESFALADASVAHSYTVTITAWDDPTGEAGWTQTIEGTTMPCFTPICTGTTDHDEIVGDGVLEVDGDWDTASIDVPFSGTLAEIGTTLNITADPIQYVGLHIRTAEGTITYEEEPSYGGKLWSNSSWAGVNPGMGYAAFGSIEEYIHLNGDVVVTGIDLLYTHPEASATTVDSFTIGCTTYEFVAEEEPPVEEPEPTEPPVVTPQQPAVAAPAPAEAETVQSDILASTGFDTRPLGWMALAGLLAGLALLGGVTIAAKRQR